MAGSLTLMSETNMLTHEDTYICIYNIYVIYIYIFKQFRYQSAVLFQRIILLFFTFQPVIRIYIDTDIYTHTQMNM